MDGTRPTDRNDMERPRNPSLHGLPSEPQRGALGRPVRVLLVEDQSLVALDCQLALESHGHEVVAQATTAEEALTAATEHRPDLIVMDIRLRGSRTGIEAGIEIYRKLGIRCIFASAHGGEAYTRRLADPAHPLGWLQKPFSGDDLAAAIDAVIPQLAVSN